VINAKLLNAMGLFALYAKIPSINKSRVRRKYETSFIFDFNVRPVSHTRQRLE